MRLLFLISDNCWNARAQVFVSAARGLSQRQHQAVIACESECPVQTRASEAGVEVVSLDANASGAGDALRLRRALNDRNVDVIFVHTDAEHLIASSAARLGAGAAAVVRRIPAFAAVEQTRTGRFASRMTPSALLFSTEADRERAGNGRMTSGVAPLGVDLARADAVRAHTKAALGAPPGCTLIVCVHDGVNRPRALTALRVLSLLSPRHPELHLAVVGDGATDELRMHGAALGINAMVSYLGARDDEQAVLRAADVGWIAAEGDAAALAALDFMAFRIPIVAERTPLTEHYIADGMTGFLLPVADAPTTAAAVAAFLAKTDQRSAMGNAGRARLERDFTFDAMVQGFESIATSVGKRLTQRVG